MGFNLKNIGKKNKRGDQSPDFGVSEEYSDEEFYEEEYSEEEYSEEDYPEDEYAGDDVAEEDYTGDDVAGEDYAGDDIAEEDYAEDYGEEYAEESETEYADDSEAEYAEDAEADCSEETDDYAGEPEAEYSEESDDDYAEESEAEYTDFDDDYMVSEAAPEDVTQVIGVHVPEVVLEELDLSTAAINADAIEKAVSRRQLRKEPEFFDEVRSEQDETDDYAENSDESGYDDYAENSDERESRHVDRKLHGDDRDEYSDYDGGVTSSIEYIDESEYEEEVPTPAPNIAFKISILAASVALILAAVFGFNYFRSKKPVNESLFTISEAGLPVCKELMGVGSEISTIDTIGGRGLLAALDSRKALALSGNPGQAVSDEGESHEYNETPITASMRISIELITVKSDLKIRFINAETGKLIPNVPFSVTITDPSGKSSTWTDDDSDGIIYKSGLTEGSYRVRTQALEGDKYSAYTWPDEKSITVKNTIDYSRVDVGGEVKDASQVNENAEDTSGRSGNEGQDLTNTVAFVESSSTPQYTEVAKNTINDPLAALTIQVEPGIHDEVIFTAEDVSGNGESGNGGSNTGGENGNSANTGGENGNGSNTGGNTTPAEKPSVTLSLSQTTMSVKAGATGTFTASTTVKVAPGCTLSVSSSNTGVATVSLSGNTITVTGVAGGTADITVTATTDKNDKVTETATASAKCTVTVTSVDMTTPLTDKSGNEVYVFENNAYRRATYADYAKFDKFYIITGTKYTGWQTFNGATYYYDSEGKAVTGTQVIQGVTYQFGADGKMTSSSGVLGIDVSKWQGKIDWAAVKASGVEYVIIRVGYRGSSAGALIDDSMFVTNISGAKAAGLKVGVYFVTQAINDVEAVYEASMVLDRIKGYSLDLPVFLDVEASGGRGDTIDKATRTAVCVAFCETIRNAGYKAGIYANKTWLSSKMDASAFSNYTIWVAHYSSVCGYTGRYDIWQYSEKGTVSGINGYVDMDLKYT